jgi:NADPH-dependent curcumin reductase CurA
MEKTETITIRGILIPTAWNERGDVVAVAIATYNEEKYLVSNDEMVPNLLSLLRKRVVVNGIVNRQNTDRIVDIKDIKMDTFKAKGKKEKANE